EKNTEQQGHLGALRAPRTHHRLRRWCLPLAPSARVLPLCVIPDGSVKKEFSLGQFAGHSILSPSRAWRHLGPPRDASRRRPRLETSPLGTTRQTSVALDSGCEQWSLEFCILQASGTISYSFMSASHPMTQCSLACRGVVTVPATSCNLCT